MVRYPHTGIFTYTQTGTYTALGVFSPGTVTTLSVACNVQPAGGGSKRYVVNTSGDNVFYTYNIFSGLLPTTLVRMNGVTFNFAGKEFPVVEMFNYQDHAETKV
jgi:hypothetical protein